MNAARQFSEQSKRLDTGFKSDPKSNLKSFKDNEELFRKLDGLIREFTAKFLTDEVRLYNFIESFGSDKGYNLLHVFFSFDINGKEYLASNLNKKDVIDSVSHIRTDLTKFYNNLISTRDNAPLLKEKYQNDLYQYCLEKLRFSHLFFYQNENTLDIINSDNELSNIFNSIESLRNKIFTHNYRWFYKATAGLIEQWNVSLDVNDLAGELFIWAIPAIFRFKNDELSGFPNYSLSWIRVGFSNYLRGQNPLEEISFETLSWVHNYTEDHADGFFNQNPFSFTLERRQTILNEILKSHEIQIEIDIDFEKIIEACNKKFGKMRTTVVLNDILDITSSKISSQQLSMSYASYKKLKEKISCEFMDYLSE